MSYFEIPKHLKRLVRIRKECEQIVRDVNYYNGLHPDQKPIDSEQNRIDAHNLRQVERLIKENEHDKAESLFAEICKSWESEEVQ